MSDSIPEIKNIHTTAFVLSMLSNLGAGKSDPSPDVLINGLTKAIYQKLDELTFKFFFGDWKIALGPYIFQHSPKANMIDNAVVVFYNAKKNIYVVALSATNSASDYDWAVRCHPLWPQGCTDMSQNGRNGRMFMCYPLPEPLRETDNSWTFSRRNSRR